LCGDFLDLYLRDLSLPVLYRLVPELRCSSPRPLFGYFELRLLDVEGCIIADVVTLICEILRFPG
jgi:hypothetical protein